MNTRLDFALPDGTDFSLPTEWWLAAGMLGFKPSGPAYRVDETPDVELIAIRDIAPLRDMSGRQHLGFGGFDPKRMIRILEAFAHDTPLPPIERDALATGPYRYGLGNGTHRFYASVAAGFTMVPTILRWRPEPDTD